jgi:uncharacterized protein (UPF0303 family)
MDSVVDLAESRKAKTEKSEQFRDAARDLLMVLERQREYISEEFMTFLVAMAVSDQALYYAQATGQKRDGDNFIENLFNTTRQLFEAHYPAQHHHSGKADSSRSKTDEISGGQILQFIGEPVEKPVE